MRSIALVVALVFALTVAASANLREQLTYRIDRVTDGDTVVLRNGQKVRLVQIDTPEVLFGTTHVLLLVSTVLAGPVPADESGKALTHDLAIAFFRGNAVIPRRVTRGAGVAAARHSSPDDRCQHQQRRVGETQSCK